LQQVKLHVLPQWRKFFKI